jgi:predicted RNase H-like nuclease (RuvC/YqgF family)
MNRASIILLCITTLVIFFILKEQPKLDIQKYEDQINMLQSEINLLETANDSLIVKAAILSEKVTEYDNTIEQLNNKIDVIQDETKKKLDSIDRYNNDQLQKFFANRYKDTIK